eukprot:TRINITY_DN24601_c0_g1_i1.p1 TRINITY_DN24601_c0_g1~~TRINITY_DN24601_c0_g1_i1.p1  ORF type:complete len:484 (+),score=135.49 TRINITY_DN24601_c0_g1_i1:203-1453(+)
MQLLQAVRAAGFRAEAAPAERLAAVLEAVAALDAATASCDGPQAQAPEGAGVRQQAYPSVLRRWREFSPDDLGKVLHAYAACGACNPDALFLACARELPGTLPGAPLHAMVLIALAFAARRMTPADVKAVLEGELVRRRGELTPEALVDAATLLALWDDAAPAELWGALRDAAAPQLDGFPPNALAEFAALHVCHAGPLDRDFSAAVAASAAPRVAEFVAADAARVVQCVGHAVFVASGEEAPAHRAFFAVVARDAMARLGEYGPEALHGLVTGAAHSSVRVEGFAPAVWGALAEGGALAAYDGDDLADILCAAALLSGDGGGEAALERLAGLAAGVAARLSQFSPDALHKVAYSYSRAGSPPRALFDALAMEVSGRLAEFTPQQLAGMAAAFARAGMDAPSHWGEGTEGQGGVYD